MNITTYVKKNWLINPLHAQVCTVRRVTLSHAGRLYFTVFTPVGLSFVPCFSLNGLRIADLCGIKEGDVVDPDESLAIDIVCDLTHFDEELDGRVQKKVIVLNIYGPGKVVSI